MQPCIDEVRARLESMLEGVAASGRFALPDIRVGVIGFRDHGSEFLTKDLGFDSDFGVLKAKLQSLHASGGGDGPEGQCDALDAASNAAWRDEALKVTIMITDSPPHGIGEVGDKLPNGCPLRELCLSCRVSRPQTCYREGLRTHRQHHGRP